MKRYIWTLVALSILGLGSITWAASKRRPAEARTGHVFEKVSPNMKLEAEVEEVERHGRRVVVSLTAKRKYDNLKYKVQFHPQIELLGTSALEGQSSLAENESLVLTYLFDVRDVSEVVALQITAFEEMSDRKRHGITEMIEVYRPAGAMKAGEESQQFPPEKMKRIFQ
jgi:hypothetical protein